MTEAIRQRFDFSDYLSLEENSTVKHEYLGGIVWAMAGGSPDHARIAANITAWLSTQLVGRRCTVFGSGLRVRVLATGLGTYPDVTVVCGPLEFDAEDAKRHTVVNPALIVEILSPTEEYDRGEKLLHYQQIDSLQEVVLVAQSEQRIEIWRRGPHAWELQTRISDRAHITTLDCDLPLATVYRDPLAG